IVHELAHVRRLDFLTQLLARIACAVYWFNPLAWLASARGRIEQELACDDLALGRGFKPADYAEHLLTVLRGTSVRGMASTVAPAMAGSLRIERRQRLILSATHSRRPLGRRRTALSALVALGLLVPLASARLA